MSDYKEQSLIVTAERLSRCEILSDIKTNDLADIAEFCWEESYLDGNVIFRENEPATKLIIVERGKLALEKRIEIGRHSTPRNATVAYVSPCEVAGFSTLTQPHIYSTSVVCIEPTRVICIDGEKLRKYLTTHTDVGYKVMINIASLVGSRYRNATHTLTYFLSIVSHELRSPLAAIENYLRTMLGGFAGELTEKQERMVKRSILRVTDLRALIGDVVDLARMRPEQIQADFEWFDPGEVGTESIEDARLAAAEKDIHIQIKAPPNFEPIVGARRRLRQVLTNLLNNAIKYSPSGSIVICKIEYEPEKIIFTVEDEGPGIEKEDLPHIFKDFFRGSNVNDATGSGLGLSISKKIIEAHNGDILIENILDDENKVTGTRFTVIIPRNLKTPKFQQSDRLFEGEDEN